MPLHRRRTCEHACACASGRPASTRLQAESDARQHAKHQSRRCSSTERSRSKHARTTRNARHHSVRGFSCAATALRQGSTCAASATRVRRLQRAQSAQRRTASALFAAWRVREPRRPLHARADSEPSARGGLQRPAAMQRRLTLRARSVCSDARPAAAAGNGSGSRAADDRARTGCVGAFAPPCCAASRIMSPARRAPRHGDAARVLCAQKHAVREAWREETAQP